MTLAEKSQTRPDFEMGKVARAARASRNVAADMIQRINVPEDVPGTCLSRGWWLSGHDDVMSLLTTGDSSQPST